MTFRFRQSDTRTQAGPTPTRSKAFTLIELMMAMMILAIGLAAIASIFPVAGYLQREAQVDVATANLTRNAEAVMFGIPVNPNDVAPSLTVVDTSGLVHPLKNLDDWPLSMRCYPMALDVDGDGNPNEASVDAEDSDFDNRQFYWFPLVMDGDAGADRQDWRVYLFILEKRRNANVKYLSGMYTGSQDIPNVGVVGVTGTGTEARGTIDYPTITLAEANLVQPGDQILTSLGSIHVVVDISDNGRELVITGPAAGLNPAPTVVWYGTPSTDKKYSSCRRIVVMGDEAVQ